MARLSQVFTGKDRVFFDLFEEAAANVVRGADLLDQMLAHYPDRADLARDIVICEQEGDRITHDVHQRLNSTFVTPIDREDVLQAHQRPRRHHRPHRRGRPTTSASTRSRRRWSSPSAWPTCSCRPRARSPRRCRGCAPSTPISHYTVEVHRLENEGDRISRDAIASLFESGIDPLVVIRWKDIFERLEEAIDACEHVANTLEGIVIKNS